MSNRESEFFDFVFESFLGSSVDEDNMKYTIVYKHEIKEFIHTLKNELEALLNTKGDYTQYDIEILFRIKFYTFFGDIKNDDNISDIALMFDEIYCEDFDKSQLWH